MLHNKVVSRLSRDDGGDSESNSIQTQRMMLQKYAKDHGFPIFSEYVDDGVSGTTFERIGFQKMIEDIEEGKVSIVICKDLSRLGRNNAMISFYTEMFFPDRDIRLIAIGDGIDTAKGDNDILPFKSVINEYYAKDISKKIRSARKVQMQNGQYTAHVAPLGYIKDPQDRHKLVIEEQGARVVRRIFELAASGLGTGKIARQLNDERIPTARQHWEFANPDVHWDWNYHPDIPACWKSSTVRNIITNRTYTGMFVGHKYTTKSFKNRKVVKVPESEWIEVPGVHPVLIDEKTWELAQRVLKIKQRANNKKHENIYVGFLKCSDCGTGLSLKYTPAANGSHIRGFMCNRYRSPALSNGLKICSAHYVSEKVLEQALLTSIRKFAEAAKANALHANNDIAPFKNILNDMYAKDISVKSRTALRTKARKGEFLGAHAPYGYLRDPSNKNRLIINPETAPTARRVFDLVISGLGFTAIAKIFNAEGIMSPGDYAKQLRQKPNDGEYVRKYKWAKETLCMLARNQMYVGDMVQCRKRSESYRTQKIQWNKKEDWIIVEGTHEGIVSREIYDRVQRIIDGRTRIIKKKDEPHLFSGFFYCENCGNRMAHHVRSGYGDYFSCGKYRAQGRQACSSHHIKVDTLAGIVLADIQENVHLIEADEEKAIRQLEAKKCADEEKRLSTSAKELAKQKSGNPKSTTELKRCTRTMLPENFPIIYSKLFCRIMKKKKWNCGIPSSV